MEPRNTRPVICVDAILMGRAIGICLWAYKQKFVNAPSTPAVDAVFETFNVDELAQLVEIQQHVNRLVGGAAVT